MSAAEAAIDRARKRAWGIFTQGPTTPLSPEARILTSAPVTGLGSDADLTREVTAPLVDGLLNLSWRADVLIAGYSGDSLWSAHTGTMEGLFADTLWGIPPSGRRVKIRYGEFTRLVDGEVAELRVLADLPGLAAQSGWHLFGATEVPDAGGSGRSSADINPHTRTSQPAESAATSALLDRFLGPDRATQSEVFHADARRWQCHGLAHVPGAAEDAAPPDACIVDGEAAAICSWADGNTPSMQFFVRRGGRFAESWLLVDLVHAAAHRGRDLLARD